MLLWSNTCGTLPVFMGMTNSARIFGEGGIKLPNSNSPVLPNPQSYKNPIAMCSSLVKITSFRQLCYAMLCQKLLMRLSTLGLPKFAEYKLTVRGNRWIKVQEVSGHKPVLRGGWGGGRWRQRVEASHRLVDDGSGKQVLSQVGCTGVLTPRI